VTEWSPELARKSRLLRRPYPLLPLRSFCYKYSRLRHVWLTPPGSEQRCARCGFLLPLGLMVGLGCGCIFIVRAYREPRWGVVWRDTRGWVQCPHGGTYDGEPIDKPQQTVL